MRQDDEKEREKPDPEEEEYPKDKKKETVLDDKRTKRTPVRRPYQAPEI